MVVKAPLIYCDSSAQLSLKQVTDKNFVPFKSDQELTCNTCHYWIKFQISNPDQFKEGNLVTLNSVVKAQLFYKCPDAGVLVGSEEVGFHQPYPQYNSYLFPYLKFKTTDSVSYYYYKFQIIEGKYFYPTSSGYNALSDTQYLLNHSTRQYIYLTIIISVIMLVAFFTFLIYIKLKERMYLWYFLYLISAAFFVLFLFNIPFRFIYHWHLNLWRLLDSYALFYTLMTVFLNLYSQSFLNLKQYSKPLYRTLTAMILLKIFIFILGVFFNKTMAEYSYNSYFFHNPIIDFICLTPAYLAGIYFLFKGDKYTRYFVGAFSLIFAGYILQAFGLTIKFSLFRELKTGFISNTFFDLITLEVVLFTMAMAERFRLIRHEKENTMQTMIIQLEENAQLKEKVNRELEAKVAERTAEIQSQAEEIARMNHILVNNNLKLVENVKDLTKAKVTHQPVSFDEFKQTYPDEASCFRYLSELKWGSGFTCRKCGNHTFIEGKNVYAHRCNKCWYEETPTIGTIFHKLKFPIEKAFYLLFLVTNNKKISIEELSRTLDLSDRTCWSYKNKILDATNARKKGKATESWEAIILV